jgi:hypothetical protein
MLAGTPCTLRIGGRIENGTKTFHPFLKNKETESKNQKRKWHFMEKKQKENHKRKTVKETWEPFPMETKTRMEFRENNIENFGI